MIPAIMKHRNDIFDWIFEHRFMNENPNSENFKTLIYASIEYGNAHSLIELIYKGYELSDHQYIGILVKTACCNGFCSIAQLLFYYMNNDISIKFSIYDLERMFKRVMN